MAKSRSRPSPELVARQRDANDRFHREQAALPFEEKIRRLLQLQRDMLPVIAARRALRPWEQPWSIEP